MMEDEPKIRRRKIFRDGLIISLSILIAVIIHQLRFLENFFEASTGTYFFLIAFVSGIFFASTFTVTISTSIFLSLVQTHNPLVISLVGGLGALMGDTFIFKFLKDDLIADFEYLETHFPQKIAKRIIHSKLIFWFAPFIAAFLIASPLPDEIGLLMLAGIKLKYRHFSIISFVLNTLGILVITFFGKVL